MISKLLFASMPFQWQLIGSTIPWSKNCLHRWGITISLWSNQHECIRKICVDISSFLLHPSPHPVTFSTWSACEDLTRFDISINFFNILTLSSLFTLRNEFKKTTTSFWYQSPSINDVVTGSMSSFNQWWSKQSNSIS